MRLFTLIFFLLISTHGVSDTGFATIKYELKKGTKLLELSKSLKNHQVIDSPKLFYYYVKFFADFSKFQAGNYLFKKNSSYKEITAQMTEGKVHRELLYQINLPEGQPLERKLSKLQEMDPSISKATIRTLLKDKSLIKELGIKTDSLEGFLYPATYSFYKQPTLKSLISKAVQKFKNTIGSEFSAKLNKYSLTMEKWVIFASLIEAETQIQKEYPLVAEVIWNRLKKKDFLGIDAALIYGIKNYKGDITWAHLKDKKNKYNLRVFKGLPPTAIGSPSISALQAVFEPTNFGYYFYVTKTDGTKEHHFSKTLKEHQLWVRKLVKATKGKK